jgi:hypothetical protein
MSAKSRPFIAVFVLLVLSGCGGGSDVTCSDFKLQQDAQAAYRGGETQLDADNDGIACENLPTR